MIDQKIFDMFDGKVVKKIILHNEDLIEIIFDDGHRIEINSKIFNYDESELNIEIFNKDKIIY